MAFGFGFKPFGFGIQRAVAGISWLLNALGISSSGTGTVTTPTSSWAPDYTGTPKDMGNLYTMQGGTAIRTLPVVGARIATTVADGAVLGADKYTGTYSSITTSTVEWRTLHKTAVDTAPYLSGAGGQPVAGRTYKVTVTVDNYVSGNWRVDYGGVSSAIPIQFSGGTQTVEVTAVSGGYLYIVGNLAGDVTVDVLAEVLPVAYDTAADGTTPLQPYTNVLGIKKYTFHAPVARNTAYIAGDKRSAVASDGTTRYYECTTGGTSAASAPTFPTSGTVADGGVTWSHSGYHTLKGFRPEPARTNYFWPSATFTTKDTGSLGTGTYTCWMRGGTSIAISAGTATITGAGTATPGAPLTFAVTVAGTVTATVTGSPTHAQLELGAAPSSDIVTTTAAVTRSVAWQYRAAADMQLGDTINVALIPAETTGTRAVTLLSDGTRKLYADASGNLVFTDGVTTLTAVQSLTAGTYYEIDLELPSSGLWRMSLNGSSIATATATATPAWSGNVSTGSTPTGTEVFNGTIFNVEAE